VDISNWITVEITPLGFRELVGTSGQVPWTGALRVACIQVPASEVDRLITTSPFDETSWKKLRSQCLTAFAIGNDFNKVRIFMRKDSPLAGKDLSNVSEE
jgi:hypothetical protein